jgi:hypothetical protein
VTVVIFAKSVVTLTSMDLGSHAQIAVLMDKLVCHSEDLKHAKVLSMSVWRTHVADC